MNRRTTLKAIAATSVGALAIGYWATDEKFINALMEKSFFSSSEQDLITAISDTIIPRTNLYGAVDLGVPVYLLGYFEKCTEAEDQQIIKNQLRSLNQLAKKKYKEDFQNCESKQREELLLAFANSEEEAKTSFLKMMKEQTIRGFDTTQEVMTNQYHYRIVPGHFDGCLDINEDSVT